MRRRIHLSIMQRGIPMQRLRIYVHLLSGFSQMARELVRLGAEVDRVGSDGMTPLHYASRLQILTLHVFWVLVLGNNFLKKSS